MKNQIALLLTVVRQVAIGTPLLKNTENGEQPNTIKEILAILLPMKKEMVPLL